MAIFIEDTFQRSNVASPSWGTATDGHAWTIETNNATTVQVNSNAGQITGGSNAGTNLLFGSASRTDAEILVQTSLSNANAASHPILRFVSHGNFYYAGQDISGNLAIKVRVSDVGTQLAATANTVTANQKFWLRFRIQGATLSLRFWLDGNAEPGTWNLQTTDTTYAGGAIGYRGTPSTGSDTVSLYSYQCNDLSGVPTPQLVADTFTRSNQSGFGTSSDGQPWSQKDANATLSILFNQGKATSFAGSSNVVLGATLTYDGDYKIRFSVQTPASNACFFLVRWTAASSFYYVGFVNNTLSIRRDVSGTQTTLASSSFTPSASTAYWLRVLNAGTSFKAKAWQDGTSEPTTWAVTTTDSSFADGSPGLRLFASTSTDSVLVDSFTVNAPSSGHLLISDGLGGVFI